MRPHVGAQASLLVLDVQGGQGFQAASLASLAEIERSGNRAPLPDSPVSSKADARKKDNIERRRDELAAEAKYQGEIRRIERSNKSRRREHRDSTYIERRAESDDEVRANISRDLVPLFERVKREIKAAPRISRTEAFLLLFPARLCSSRRASGRDRVAVGVGR